jgi:hypothetical protein
LEHVLIEKVEQLFRDMLFVVVPIASISGIFRNQTSVTGAPVLVRFFKRQP